MLRKLTKLVTNNFGLKVLGAVLAVILWMVIVNVEDPSKSSSLTIPVQITHGEYLTEMGKTFEIRDNTDQISFVVTGQRSVIERIKPSDFTAIANMENIDDTLTMIPIVITCSNYSNQLKITKKSSYVLVNVENQVTQSFKVNVVPQGNPAKGCFIQSLSSAVKEVAVTGPESVVAQIASAQVVLDVSGATKDVVAQKQIVLRDEQGAEISTDRLTIDENETSVTAKIEMKKTISLDFDVVGEPAAGYRMKGIESTVKEIDLIGSYQTLSALETLKISAAQLNISGVNASVSAVIKLSDYLPEGVVLAEGEPQDITVTISIEAQDTIDVNMPIANVTISGLDSGLNLGFNSQSVLVRITGYRDELSQIDGNRLKGTIDVSGLSEGNYNVAVKIGGTYADRSEASVSITISADGSSPIEENPTGNGGMED